MGSVSFFSLSSPTNSATVGGSSTITGNSANTVVAENSLRSSLSIAVTQADCWIRLLPASTSPTVRKGFPVKAGQTWELPTSWWRALYSGEVSIINAADGQSPVVYVTEL